QFLSCAGVTPEDNHQQSLKRQEYGIPDNQSLIKMVDKGGITAPKGPVGSVLFFECNVMHGSNSNISPFSRRNMFMVFNSVENTLVEPFCGLEPRPPHIANRRDFSPIGYQPE
ncbi:MAG TPA: phytanoyl-CoA dioxygenase family protein, partial [Gammaproteobacteria bacterium]|nr:phytanoyl-CoA dioxygenase family protein [Gammaproteobacteria bacterium]